MDCRAEPPRWTGSTVPRPRTAIFLQHTASKFGVGLNETAVPCITLWLLCRGTCRDAPSGPGTVQSNEVPPSVCEGVAGCFRRLCLAPAPTTLSGAPTPIECRLRRTLTGGAQLWGKRNRNVE